MFLKGPALATWGSRRRSPVTSEYEYDFQNIRSTDGQCARARSGIVYWDRWICRFTGRTGENPGRSAGLLRITRLARWWRSQLRYFNRSERLATSHKPCADADVAVIGWITDTIRVTSSRHPWHPRHRRVVVRKQWARPAVARLVVVSLTLLGTFVLPGSSTAAAPVRSCRVLQ